MGFGESKPQHLDFYLYGPTNDVLFSNSTSYLTKLNVPENRG